MTFPAAGPQISIPEGFPAAAGRAAMIFIRTIAPALTVLDIVMELRGPRNGHLAGQNHPVTGIPFDKSDYPDFSKVSIKDVQIQQSGNRGVDERAANKAANLKNTPDGFTWHHHQDKKTMQLVPSDVHGNTGHSGGVSNLKEDEK